MPGTDPHDPGASPAPPDAARAVDGDRSRVVWRLVGVHGRVQGVGFRDACCDLATALGVAGWVRNRRDGTVEALLHGPAERVERLCAALARATPGTRVDRLVVRDVDGPSGATAVLGDAAAPSGTGFERRPTA